LNNSIAARIERAVTELERLCTRLGTITAIQSIIEAGVDVTRALELLDGIQPANNAEYRQKHSVKMEHVLAAYMAEEKGTRSDIDAARLLLMQLVIRANGDG
jgi:hypothetical protein